MKQKIVELARQTGVYGIYKKLLTKTASIIHGNPTDNMLVIGVTGTDGKTTTTTLIHHILQSLVGDTAMISTALIKIRDQVLPNETKMTSLSPFKLFEYLKLFAAEGIKIVVLEVSSHGLDQHRFEGIDFDIGVLTNISPEHLDYHKTLENYAETKKKLFLNIIYNKKSTKAAVLPQDDEFGREWINTLSFDKLIDYGIHYPASLKATQIYPSIDNLKFDFTYLGQKYQAQVSNLAGDYNAANTLAAIGVGLIFGLDIKQILEPLKSFPGVPGRLEKIHKKGKLRVVDFAHTPQALEAVLSSLQKVKKNKIITVFGAPGNRDPFKRPFMGEVVDKLSDVIILTDDDPDSENRYYILNQVREGIKRKLGENFFIIPERPLAISLADKISNPGDIILVAGKGHENVRLTNWGKKKYSDKETILSL